MKKTMLYGFAGRFLMATVLCFVLSSTLTAQQKTSDANAVPLPQGPAAALSVLGIAPPDHVVIVIEENHSFSNIIGSTQAPYINSLAQQGALFTQSFAVGHPSQPNYLELFSGSNQGVTSDTCPQTFSAENLASELVAAGLTFKGFSEGLPSVGSTVCTSGAYARKHNPWSDFTNVSTSLNLPFTSFPTNFTTLPKVSIVVPNLNDDMHDGTIAQGDTWLQQHIDSYVQFAKTNNSLLIVTWDEDDNSSGNQIPTFFVGPMVKQGQFGETINHFNVLRTIEDLYGLTHAASAATATPITDVWNQDFSISASPASLSVNQGSSGSTTITSTISGGFNSAVSFSVSGLPTGVTASFAPASLAAPGSGSSTLTLTASSTATTGTANLTITATGGTITHTTTVALTVVASSVPSFTLSASPAALTVSQGSSGNSTVSTVASGGFNSAIALSASGLPAGVTATFSPASIAAPGTGSATLSFVASSTATVGTTNVTVTATGGGITHTTVVALTISAAATPSFTLTASPATLSVAQGNSGSSTISTTISGGFNAVVSLSVAGLPSGVTASFNPVSIAAPGNGSSTLTLSASTTATAGTATLTVTATGGGITQTATISLTITSAAPQQLLGNAGFENGTSSAPWTATTGVINNSASEPPRTGLWDAWLDGYGAVHTDTLTQTVTIPASVTSATLSFWLHVDTAETSTTTAFDTLQVQVLNTSGTVLATLGTFSNLNHATGYQQHSFSVLSFKGQTVQIRFVGTEDSILQTSFVIDDTALNVQ